MRPARALIDLQALRHNYQLAREVTGAKALAVIKADAYGHGAVRCAQALEAEADGFAVACIEEALELRAAGIRAPILLLEGFFEADELPLIVEHDFWCVVHSLWQLDAIEQARLAKPIHVWLKLDSGMHRVGLHAAEYAADCPLLEPVRGALASFERHLPRILHRWHSLHTNARLEGFNGLFQAARARARGYRNVENFITMVYLIAAPIQVVVAS